LTRSLERQLRLGVAGLGRAFTIMLPTFQKGSRVKLTGAADPRPEARERFAAEFNAPAFASVKELCAAPDVEAIYVSTPHQLHAEHVCMAAMAGKHVLVEKPFALTISECRKMIDAAARAGIEIIVGHSHSFDAPYRRAREIIASGEVGKLGMITAMNFTDFMYRPRRPEELVTAQGGGVTFSQGAHQIDIVRLLGGGRLRSVRAQTGIWDRARCAEGAYGALLCFEDGAFANVVYSGYGHFDSDALSDWIGEMGLPKDRTAYGAARKALRNATAEEEKDMKAAHNYGGGSYRGSAPEAARAHQRFGFVVASCERADLRPTPQGVMVHADFEERLDVVPVSSVPRAEVIDELYDAIVNGHAPIHSGRWATATLETCLAILQSAREQREIPLEYQVGLET
jgi:phthalate 4,5-cis-dihydrodiol dehydrogenase